MYTIYVRNLNISEAGAHRVSGTVESFTETDDESLRWEVPVTGTFEFSDPTKTLVPGTYYKLEIASFA